MSSEQDEKAVEQKRVGPVEVFIRAWSEALSESGFERVVLVLLMLALTPMYLPVLPLFLVLDRTGVYQFHV